ncbi:hypothetical protein [Terracidiphilus sp.]|uniref:hypothetical protein n=1 Tax=Terracidiphilus sp. TaxID=1964191 RepID=UPI003C22C3AC
MDDRIGNALADGMSWTSRQLRAAPRRIFGRWAQRLPMDFRILYKQFLLRILDMEALSVEADMVEYLAQFAGILIFISGIQSLGVLFVVLLHSGPFTPAELYTMGWTAEHGIVEKMLLAAGLVVVFLWDAPFPDRRDVMVLGPLPVRPGTILAAKVASSAAVLGLAVLCLNWSTNFVWPGVLGGLHSPRLCLACWLAVTLAAAFLFSTLLAVEGLGALLLPRQVFLRLSALGQLAAFALFPIGYFLLGQIDSPTAMMAAENRWTVACWPGYWFLALLKQVAGELPPEMSWLARLAWGALALSIISAAAALIASYHRTLRRIAEQPDLEPSRSGRTWQFPLGSRLETVLVYFSLRTLGRSRQHRIALAFSWALVLGLVLGMARSWMEERGPRPVDESFLIYTVLMMALAVGGMRGVFALPIAHKANWMLRVTQLRPTEHYLAATRRVLLLFAVFPVWLVAMLFSLGYRPWLAVTGHLLLLAIFGLLAIEVSLIGFTKIPFTCSFLPGKTNMQYVFWGYVLGATMIVVFVTSCEQPALISITRFVVMAALAIAATIALRLWNRERERKAELYFEEKPEPPLITLGLIVNPRARI